MVRLPCGSRSMARTLWPDSLKATARFERGRRLGDAALLVGERDDLGGARLLGRSADFGRRAFARSRTASGAASRRGAMSLRGLRLAASTSLGSLSTLGEIITAPNSQASVGFLPVLGESLQMAELFDKRLIFVTGKGGVGKSTVSLALGPGCSRAGQADDRLRGLVPGERLEGLQAGRGRVSTRSRWTTNLWAISIDPDESLREYLLLQLKVQGDARPARIARGSSTTWPRRRPGLKELVTIGKVWELAQDERRVKKAGAYDMVIVDAPRPATASVSCRRRGRSPASPASGRSTRRPRSSTPDLTEPRA